MWPLIQFIHLVAAIVWMGGMAFMLYAMSPALALLPPPQRLVLVAGTLRRFFAIVWGAIVALLASGPAMLMHAGPGQAPAGWHLMAGIGLLMMALFAHVHFVPWRRLRRAVDAADWAAAAGPMSQIPRLVAVNFVLGWLAIAAMRFVG
jgi:uncharacterized membrane protein